MIPFYRFHWSSKILTNLPNPSTHLTIHLLTITDKEWHKNLPRDDGGGSMVGGGLCSADGEVDRDKIPPPNPRPYNGIKQWLTNWSNQARFWLMGWFFCWVVGWRFLLLTCPSCFSSSLLPSLSLSHNLHFLSFFFLALC